MSTSTSSLLKQDHMDMPEVCSSLVPGWKSGEALVVFDTAKADELVIHLIANKCLPMWLVDDADFMHLMANLRPTYKPPTRHQLWRQHLSQIEHDLHRRMQSKIVQIPDFSLTLDSWKSVANRSYVTWSIM